MKFISKFADRLYHAHMKDVHWSSVPTEAGVFGGHTKFGDPRRFWEFRSLGRGSVKFEEIVRALNQANYQGPLSVEWEDIGMDREHGAAEAAAFPAPARLRAEQGGLRRGLREEIAAKFNSHKKNTKDSKKEWPQKNAKITREGKPCSLSPFVNFVPFCG